MSDYKKEAERPVGDLIHAVDIDEDQASEDKTRAALLARIQRGVPEGWHLDESEAALLHHLTSPDDDRVHPPITLRVGNVRMDDGVVKFGLLCEYTDYPDEGATLLVEHPETAPDQFRDAAKMMAEPAEVPMPEPVAYGIGNTAITGRTNRLMMVRIAVPLDDQYAGAHWLPLVLADDARTYGAACRAAGEAAGYARGLAEAGRDAERYRWLCDVATEQQWVELGGYTVKKIIDGAIDALRGEVKP